MVDLLNGKYRDCVDEFYIIDCRYSFLLAPLVADVAFLLVRFEYEYNGGHIQAAINLPTPQLCDEFLDNPILNRRVVFIFHCEFSQKRAPAT